MATITETQRDELEASCRRLMARHAAIEPRGFDTTRQRLRLQAEIDDVLDQIKALDEQRGG